MPATPSDPAGPRIRGPRAGGDHLWRHVVEDDRSKTREGASGRDGRAAVTGVWKLPERWTRRARAHRPWKTTEQFSTSSHTHPRGHFYRVKNGDISNEL